MAGYNPIVVLPPSNTGLPGGIPTSVTVDNFDKGIDENGPYYHVVYYINNWSDSDTFANALLGYVTGSGQDPGGFTKASPHAFPLSPNLLCRRCRVLAPGCAILGTSGLPNFYGGALIEAEYRPRLWQSAGFQDQAEQVDPFTAIPFCTQELDHRVEYLTIDETKSNLFYDTTGAPTGQPFRIRIPVTTLRLTFHLSPNLFLATNTIRAVRGCVNSQSFLGAAAGTVLFTGCHTTRKWDSLGNVVQEISLEFQERSPQQLWNALPDKDDYFALPWPLVHSGNDSASKPYPTADYNQYIYSF